MYVNGSKVMSTAAAVLLPAVQAVQTAAIQKEWFDGTNQVGRDVTVNLVSTKGGFSVRSSANEPQFVTQVTCKYVDTYAYQYGNNWRKVSCKSSDIETAIRDTATFTKFRNSDAPATNLLGQHFDGIPLNPQPVERGGSIEFLVKADLVEAASN